MNDYQKQVWKEFIKLKLKEIGKGILVILITSIVALIFGFGCVFFPNFFPNVILILLMMAIGIPVLYLILEPWIKDNWNKAKKIVNAKIDKDMKR